MILYGKPVVENIENNLKKEFSKEKWQGKYIAIFLLQDHGPSKVYVNKKKQFGEKIGMKVNIIDWNDIKTLNQLLDKIDFLNKDKYCVGIVIQLPLPEKFQKFQAKILSKISPIKDIDGLGGILLGLSSIGLINFVPATPKAAIKILEYYKLDNFKGKKVSILGQSNLVGKPLALEIIKRGGEIFSFNHFLDVSEIKKFTRQSDFIFSATGQTHLIGKDWVNANQIIVDIGWGYINGKPAGDVNFEEVKDTVEAITPVPGGVGPITVASLFENIIDVQNYLDELPIFS